MFDELITSPGLGSEPKTVPETRKEHNIKTAAR
jgi:hypothetical protein